MESVPRILPMPQSMTTETIRYSIVTICFNESASIRSNCESIKEQTFRNYEWLVIDGGSTDGTLDILNEYAEQLRLLISEPDGGIYEAMNKGILHARGEYVIFMNSGDAFADCEVLERASRAIGESEADLFVGGIVVDKDGKKCFPPDRVIGRYLRYKMLPHQSAFFKRELFQKHGLFNESYRIAGDYEMFARLLIEKRSHINTSRR